MSQHEIIVLTVRHGQPRPYADSTYEAYISCRRTGVLTNNAIFYQRLTRAAIEDLTRIFVRPFHNPAAWHESALVTCDPVGPTPEMTEECHEKWPPTMETRWHVKVVKPYLD